jgi:hypothetical protein
MASPRGARAGVVPLLWLGGVLCLVLGLVAVLLLREAPPPPPPERTLQERVEAIDVVKAADRMGEQLVSARAALTPALMPGEEETLAQLLRMQAEAADVELGTLRFETIGREGLLESVGLELQLTGAYYDLPIFVDGLYRQRHAVEIHRLTIESAGPGAVRVAGRVEARLFRPVAVSAQPIRDSVDAVDLSASERGFAANALAAAAQLEAYERFLELQPALLERKQANRRLVMRTIPRLVRKLPSSPMDWVGATFSGGEAQLAME